MALQGKQNTLIFDDTPLSGSNNPVKSGGIYTALSGKMNTMTIDQAPTLNSQNLVTSGGVYAAIASGGIVMDDVPTSGSNNAVKSGGVYTALQAKQNTLTFDNAPMQNSTNMVNSGAVYTALAGKMNAMSIDSAPTQNSQNLVRSGGIYTALSGKMNSMTVDSSPTQNSTNLITSGGVYGAIAAATGSGITVNHVSPDATGDINITATDITVGIFATARIPNLDASKIVSGTFNVDRLPLMGAATSSSSGSSGIVPTPLDGDNTKVLTGGAVWTDVSTLLTLDAAPTSSSTNLISSGAVYTALTNKVDKSGDTMTGDLGISTNGSPALNLSKAGDSFTSAMYTLNVSTSQALVRSRNRTNPNAATVYENFYFPAPDADRTSSVTYHVLTDKNTVTVPQGGTGAATAAEARTNLEITPENIGAAKIGSVSNPNANDFTTPGLYYLGTTATNVPSGTNGFLIVIANSNRTLVKQFFSRMGTVGTNDYQFYFRTRTPDGWGSWYAVITDRGGTISGGNLIFDGGVNYRGINLKGASGAPQINLYNTGSRLTIDQYANGSTGGERYLMPTVSSRSSDVWYSILTSKTTGAVTLTYPSAVACPSGTNTCVANFTLQPGSYIVECVCSWPTNADGYRILRIATDSEGGGTNRFRQDYKSAVASTATTNSTVFFLNVSSATTYYLMALQNSGTSLNCTPGVSTIKIT